MSKQGDELVKPQHSQELDDGLSGSLGVGANGVHYQLPPHHLLQHQLQDVCQAAQGQNMNHVGQRQQFQGKEYRVQYQDQQQDSLSANKELVSLSLKSCLEIFFSALLTVELVFLRSFSCCGFKVKRWKGIRTNICICP